MDGTIVAIATPLGEGGLGVVRLSGPQALAIADAVFKSKQKLSAAAANTLHHGWIVSSSRRKPGSSFFSSGEGLGSGFRRNDGPFIDEVVAAVFRAPHSYTGEDVVEFSCHGSPVALKEVVDLCLAQGARGAQPGEFTQRAYLNGKLDLPQAEAVADLIHAQSSKARAAAAAQLGGMLSSRLNGIRQLLIDLAAKIEANLDFVEEKLPIVSTEEIAKSLKKTLAALEALLSTSVKGRLLREGLRVALAGKPNVGKSSLFNALLAQDRAIVTDIPGTTRDTLEEKLEWNGLPVVLTDTAGVRPTADPVETQGTERARRAHAISDVVLLVLDGSAPLTPEDQHLIDQLHGQTVVTVLNKSDQGNRINPQQLPAGASGRVVATSAKTGAGLEELKKLILQVPGGQIVETEDAVVITNERHARLLGSAAEKIRSALKALEEKKSEEALAVDVRAALESLSAVAGENVSDDVLSSIFRQFCIGK